jgi:SHS2 domain-containing protein
MGRWRELDHTADLALHVWGRDLEDLFAAAATGMFSLLAETAPAGAVVRFELHLTALDAESLLIDWLNELLYLCETQDFVGTEFIFGTLTPTELHAEVVGLPVRERRADIKAATYHMLAVVALEAGYETEVVFDV